VPLHLYKKIFCDTAQNGDGKKAPSALSFGARLRLFTWLFLALVSGIDAVGLHLENITLHFGDVTEAVYFLILYMAFSCGLYGAAWLFTYRWPHAFMAKACYHVAVFIDLLCQFICFSLIFLVLSYIASASPLPYQDKIFLWIDQFLKLDWVSYVEWADGKQYIRRLFALSYYSCQLQTLIAFCLLSMIGQFKRLSMVMFAFMFSSAFCILIAALLPATGMIVYQHINPGDFHNLGDQLGVGYQQVPVIEQLRNGTLHDLSFLHCVGLITFPSFHAAFATILAWAFWSLPVVRWLTLALNIAVIAATPVIGGHYFIDVIAGIAIAGIAIFLATFIANYPNSRA